jgi:protein-tyrosine phosphatase
MNHYWIMTESGRIAIMPRPRGGDWLADDIGFLQTSGVGVIVSALTPGEIEELALAEEQSCCDARGLIFYSFPINDRSVPVSLSKFNEFLRSLNSELQKGLAIAIHCRAGIGRSSLIAACLLIKQGFVAEDALRLIEEARGVPVPDTQEQRDWIKEFENLTANFLI